MNETPSSDAPLVLRAQAGDHEAFAELYDAYFARIYDFCYQMVRSRDDAADVVSDVFLKAMERLPTLKDPEAFRGWLYAIARNASLNLIERRKRTTAMPEDFEVAAKGAGPDDIAEHSELSRLVWEAAATLNPRDYSIFEMTVRQGLGSAEVAEALGVKPSHAYVLVSRLKDSIEEALSAVVLARVGRRDCPALDAIVGRFGDERSPRMRKAVGRHIKDCDECTSGRLKYASAAALLGGVARAEPAPGLKDAIAEQISQSWPPSGPRPPRGPSRGLRALTPVAVVAGFTLATLGQQADPAALSPRFAATATPTPQPTETASPTPVPTETPAPTEVPGPTQAPSRRVTPRPTARITPQPTPRPTLRPLPTFQPTARPTLRPTPRPTNPPKQTPGPNEPR